VGSEGRLDSRTRLQRSSQLLAETEHFYLLQKKVAKIVHCGEALAEKNRTSSVSTELRDRLSKERLMWSAFLLCFL
jgi:hypothetical protein